MDRNIMEHPLLREYRSQMAGRASGSIWHKTQVELAYNSNHIEGSRLTEEQTRDIFETRTIFGNSIPVDDVIETANHFRLFDEMLATADQPLTPELLLRFHEVLKLGTTGDRHGSPFQAGQFKRLENKAGGLGTASPAEVADRVKELCQWWEGTDRTFENIVAFHVRFEKIHPFQDGNGRVGRMAMFRQCLTEGVLPFIVEDRMKGCYYRGLRRFDEDPTRLTETLRSFRDGFAERFLRLAPHIPLSAFTGHDQTDKQERHAGIDLGLPPLDEAIRQSPERPTICSEEEDREVSRPDIDRASGSVRGPSA